MKIENYTKLFKNESFKDAAQAGRICLFLGAGVAQNLGMPHWNGLANKVVEFSLKNKVITHSYVKTLEALDDSLKIISVCIERIEDNNKVVQLNKQLEKVFIEAPNESYNDKNNAILFVFAVG